MIKLVSIYTTLHTAIPYLYDRLSARPKYANISHRKMPTFTEHEKFVNSSPYIGWYLVVTDTDTVGSIYLSERREVGVNIEEGHQRKGYAREAIARLREIHPGPLLANVAPNNGPSHSLFKKLGGRVIQYTYEL